MRLENTPVYAIWLKREKFLKIPKLRVEEGQREPEVC